MASPTARSGHTPSARKRTAASHRGRPSRCRSCRLGPSCPGLGHTAPGRQPEPHGRARCWASSANARIPVPGMDSQRRARRCRRSPQPAQRIDPSRSATFGDHARAQGARLALVGTTNTCERHKSASALSPCSIAVQTSSPCARVVDTVGCVFRGLRPDRHHRVGTGVPTVSRAGERGDVGSSTEARRSGKPCRGSRIRPGLPARVRDGVEMIDVRRWGLGVGTIVVGTPCASIPVADAAPAGRRIKTIVSHYGAPASSA